MLERKRRVNHILKQGSISQGKQLQPGCVPNFGKLVFEVGLSLLGGGG